jgi:LacI family transcriptional regulator
MSKRLQKSASRGVTLLDVARRASCSTASVSRVLNDPERVTPDIRARVDDAMRELGYMPNSAARALRSLRSRIMGIVIPTLNHAIYAGLVEALQQRLADQGYSLLVATSEYNLIQEEHQARLLIERGVEGLVLIGDVHRADLYRLLERTPYVNTYVYREDTGHPCVGFDNRRATFELTEFLIGLGHRNFGVISAVTAGNDRASDRVAGVRAALEAHGLSLPPEAVYERPYSILSGREGVRYLRSLSPAPTAIVCGNDVMAMGALVECRATGLSVPDQISIVGFDNLEFAAHLDPPLTTLEVPAAAMGERAAEFLLRRANGESALPSIHLEPKLIVRRTTGRAPARDPSPPYAPRTG